MLYTYSFDPKYAADTDGFTFDIRAWLGDIDQLAGTPTASVTPNDVTIEAVVADAGFVTVWLSGGTAGQTYQIELNVVTTGVPPSSQPRNCRIRGTFAVVA